MAKNVVRFTTSIIALYKLERFFEHYHYQQMIISAKKPAILTGNVKIKTLALN